MAVARYRIVYFSTGTCYHTFPERIRMRLGILASVYQPNISVKNIGKNATTNALILRLLMMTIKMKIIMYYYHRGIASHARSAIVTAYMTLRVSN